MPLRIGRKWLYFTVKSLQSCSPFQINYLDPGDINGFEMMVSGRSFAKCLTMESTDTPRKVNTCHTSGITYLETGESGPPAGHTATAAHKHNPSR